MTAPGDERDPAGGDGGDAALAAEYALGLLPPAEAEVVAARAAADPAFADLVAFWEERLAGLADEVDPVPPPDRVLAGLRRTLFAERDRPWWRKLGIGQALGGALASALLLMLALNQGWLGPTPLPPPAFEAEIAAEDRSLVIAAAYVAEEGALFLDRRVGAALPGRALELWLIPEGAAPVSLGVLPADALVRVPVAPALRPALAGALLAVSDEPPGGSPTGAPTGAVLAAGPVTQL